MVLDPDEEEDEDDEEDDDDDDDVTTSPLEGAYDPDDYHHLDVSQDIR